ncbi:hypothetical protein C0Q70_14543 [Pomacea canaliculata]|uniref:Uncharacterized protein n=1 Tax=Pomacea canaliculata TaxID=400727 RepID=A0A2T7NSF0_POMCA|nr:hypothetical protein C0Q70_14543 [Pomacea canaliculata]
MLTLKLRGHFTNHPTRGRLPYLTLTKSVWSQHPSPTGGSTGDRLLRPTGITPARALFMDTH